MYSGNSIYPGMTVVSSWILVVSSLCLNFSGIWAYTLIRNYFAKERNDAISEKTLIFVKLEVCLSAYPEYRVQCLIVVFCPVH